MPHQAWDGWLDAKRMRDTHCPRLTKIMPIAKAYVLFLLIDVFFFSSNTSHETCLWQLSWLSWRKRKRMDGILPWIFVIQMEKKAFNIIRTNRTDCVAMWVHSKVFVEEDEQNMVMNSYMLWVTVGFQNNCSSEWGFNIWVCWNGCRLVADPLSPCASFMKNATMCIILLFGWENADCSRFNRWGSGKSVRAVRFKKVSSSPHLCEHIDSQTSIAVLISMQAKMMFASRYSIFSKLNWFSWSREFLRPKYPLRSVHYCTCPKSLSVLTINYLTTNILKNWLWF